MPSGAFSRRNRGAEDVCGDAAVSPVTARQETDVCESGRNLGSGLTRRHFKLVVAWICKPSALREVRHDTETSLGVDRSWIPRGPGSLLRDGGRGRQDQGG